jgi:hypothetical protein
MARSLFQDGPYIDVNIANLTTLSSTSVEDMWVGAVWTPVWANDPKAGKIYCVRAGGTVSLTGGTWIVTPGIGTSSPGTTLGVSLTQGTATITIAAWRLEFDLVVRVIDPAGSTASTCNGTGILAMSGGVVSATANPNVITFGGTPMTALNATVNNIITIRKTASTTNSMIPQYVYIFSRN